MSDWYSGMGVFANPEQARAAAAMHLLAAHAKPERALCSEERLQARETAFSILGDAFQGSGGTGANPAMTVDLHGATGGFGGTREQVLGAGLRDPRAEVAGLDERLADDFLGNAARGGGATVNRFHQGAQEHVIASQTQREAMLAEQRPGYWKRQIITEANNHRPLRFTAIVLERCPAEFCHQRRRT